MAIGKLVNPAISQLKAEIGELKLQLNQCDHFLAELSEELLGYREGSNADILDRAKQLKEIEISHNRNEKVTGLFELIGTLSELANDIENS